MNKLYCTMTTLALMVLVVSHPACAEISEAAQAKLDAIKPQIDAQAEASDKVKAFAKETLLTLCANKIFAEEIQKQNDKKTPLAEIQAIDKQWIAAEDFLPIHEEKLGNACAKEITKIVDASPVLVEAFVMDNQGAVVGENQITSDYWQGDEAKWKESFNEGKGGVNVGEVEFDKSANAQLQQVSLPIVNAEGKVIGAVTFGLSIDKL